MAVAAAAMFAGVTAVTSLYKSGAFVAVVNCVADGTVHTVLSVAVMVPTALTRWPAGNRLAVVVVARPCVIERVTVSAVRTAKTGYDSVFKA